MKVVEGEWNRTSLCKPEDDEHILFSCGPDNPPKEWADGYYNKEENVILHQMSRNIYLRFPFDDSWYWMRVPEFPPFILRERRGVKHDKVSRKED